MSDQDGYKAAAAAAAVALVEDGMFVGLGTGSTAEHFIRLLGERVRAGGVTVTAVATSQTSTELAAASGIRVAASVPAEIDLAVDGADEVDPALRLIKGRGGALVREKLVAEAARRFTVIADASKLVARLGTGVLPVEVVPFMWEQTARRLKRVGATARLREAGGAPFVSDNGNLILDLAFEDGIADPDSLAGQLKSLTGVVDHGLFIGQAAECLVAGPDGVRRLEREQGAASRP